VTLAELLLSAYQQTMVDGKTEVDLAGHTYRVTRTRSGQLRVVSFLYSDQLIEGIEQNPEKASRWAQLAREGKRVMQFRCRGRYIANVCEGTLLRYPAWKGLALPD